MKTIIRNFLIVHLLIAVMMLVYFKEMTLLSYINASFIIGGIITFIGLVSLVFSTGFFDVFTVSMRKVFTSKKRMEDVMSMRKPSEIFTGNVGPFLSVGALILAATGIALIIFYL